MERSLYWYIGSRQILTNTYTTTLDYHHTNYQESVVSSLFNRGHPIITNKDDLHKENARIKALLVKFLRELLKSKLASVTATNGSHRYSRGRDQNKYKFTVR